MMSHLASRYEDGLEIQEQGVVRACHGLWYTIETKSGSYVAQKAVSCLVEPIEEDKVLIAGNEEDGLYVLAVLERASLRETTLRFETDVSLKLQQGRLSVAAQDGISLASAKDIGLASPEIDVHTSKAELSAGSLLFSGDFWLGHVSKLRLIAARLETIVERVSQQMKHCHRRVEQTDSLRAGRLDYLVDKLLSLRGRYSMLTAKEDVKIDGERIHMG
jgi:hypothetical protein